MNPQRSVICEIRSLIFEVVGKDCSCSVFRVLSIIAWIRAFLARRCSSSCFRFCSRSSSAFERFAAIFCSCASFASQKDKCLHFTFVKKEPPKGGPFFDFESCPEITENFYLGQSDADIVITNGNTKNFSRNFLKMQPFLGSAHF